MYTFSQGKCSYLQQLLYWCILAITQHISYIRFPMTFVAEPMIAIMMDILK